MAALPWRLAVPLLALALSGCGAVEYYWQGAVGQLELLVHAKPVAEVVATTDDEALRMRLSRLQAIRAYASADLALPDNASYTRYTELGRPYVVWNVFAAPALSLAPRQWCASQPCRTTSAPPGTRASVFTVHVVRTFPRCAS